MTVPRRRLLGALGAVAAVGFTGAGSTRQETRTMYGLIGRMTAVHGQRDALIDVLLAGTGSMPGCRSYVVARDPADEDVIWITEVWDNQASHQASLALPSVRAAIAKGRPLIARFDPPTVTAPVGGYGLADGQ